MGRQTPKRKYQDLLDKTMKNLLFEPPNEHYRELETQNCREVPGIKDKKEILTK